MHKRSLAMLEDVKVYEKIDSEDAFIFKYCTYVVPGSSSSSSATSGPNAGNQTTGSAGASVDSDDIDIDNDADALPDPASGKSS